MNKKRRLDTAEDSDKKEKKFSWKGNEEAVSRLKALWKQGVVSSEDICRDPYFVTHGVTKASVAGKIKSMKVRGSLKGGSAPTHKSPQRNQGKMLFKYQVSNCSLLINRFFIVLSALKHTEDESDMEGEWQGNVEEEEEEVEIDDLKPQSGYVVHHVAYQEMSMVVMLLIASPAISVEPRVSREGVTLVWKTPSPPTAAVVASKVKFVDLNVWVKSDPPTQFGGEIHISTPQPLNVEKWRIAPKEEKTQVVEVDGKKWVFLNFVYEAEEDKTSESLIF